MKKNLKLHIVADSLRIEEIWILIEKMGIEEERVVAVIMVGGPTKGIHSLEIVYVS